MKQEIKIKLIVYINQYGTKFFEGDEFSYVNKNKISVVENDLSASITAVNDYTENDNDSEIMTNRECFRFIDENWDELNKNK